MNDNTTQDPFAAIQSTEGSAEKSIEKEMQKNAEAINEAKLAKEEDLKAYEEELRAAGMSELKEVKAKAVAKMESDLSSARSEAEKLKNNAANHMGDAVKLITNAFNA